MTETVSYRGILREADQGESMNILFLGDDEDPLAERISDDLDKHGRFVTARWWTADAAMDDEAIRESALREMLGASDAKFHPHYSEYTGYLWTDEEINVGGHDLLAELRGHVGRYCLLQMTYSAPWAIGQ